MFTVKVEKLRDHLKRAQGAIEKTNVRPILANFLLDLEGKVLKAVASSNDLQITERLDADADEGVSEGKVTVNANKVMQALMAARPMEDVHVTVEGSNAKVKIGNSSYTLQTMPANEYPVHEESGDGQKLIASLGIGQAALKRLLRHVQFSMAASNHRYYLNGMFWSLRGDHVLAVATNGHRMAIDTAEGTEDGKSEHKNDAIIPRRTVLELHKLLDESSDDPVQIEVFGEVEEGTGGGAGQDAGRVRVSFGSTEVLSQVIRAKYPDHERVVPASNDNVVTVEREELRNALRRVAAVNDEREYAVAATFDELTLTVNCNTSSGDKGSDEISLASHEGKSIDISFSGVYLEEVLDHLEEANVRLALKDPQSSVLITPDGEDPTFKYILMPVRS